MKNLRYIAYLTKINSIMLFWIWYIRDFNKDSVLPILGSFLIAYLFLLSNNSKLTINNINLSTIILDFLLIISLNLIYALVYTNTLIVALVNIISTIIVYFYCTKQRQILK